MGLFRYSERELRGILSRVVAIRWPQESVLHVARCRTAPLAGDEPSAPKLPDPLRPHLLPRSDGSRSSFLAVTQSRLILQDRLTLATGVRAAAYALGLLVLMSLISSGGVVSFLTELTVALGLWTASKAIEFLTVGRGWAEHGDILFVDTDSRRVVASGPGDAVLAVDIDDPSDFSVVSELLSRRGEASAA